MTPGPWMSNVHVIHAEISPGRICVIYMREMKLVLLY